MSHLRVDKRRARKGAELNWCQSGCSTTNGYRKSGAFCFWLLSRPTYLCAKCAADWERTYNRALLNDWTVA